MKRPDQYRIDVGEAGASDYKNRRRQPEDAEREGELYSRVMKGPDVEGQPIPPDTPEPESGRERAEELERERQVRARKKGAGSADGSAGAGDSAGEQGSAGEHGGSERRTQMKSDRDQGGSGAS